MSRYAKSLRYLSVFLGKSRSQTFHLHQKVRYEFSAVYSWLGEMRTHSVDCLNFSVHLELWLFILACIAQVDMSLHEIAEIPNILGLVQSHLINIQCGITVNGGISFGFGTKFFPLLENQGHLFQYLSPTSSMKLLIPYQMK
jgi:hypothetical protein